MIMIVIAILCCVTLSISARRANACFGRHDRLPMQWWFTGEVTWSAPRVIALAFMPVLAVILFAILLILSFTLPPRPGQEAMVLPTFVGIGAMFVAIQRLHFWLIAKTLRKPGQ